METETAQKCDHHQNGFTKEITSNFTWMEHITAIDLSNKNLIKLELDFPPSLVELNISHNKLQEVPAIVLNMKKLLRLDCSYNGLTYFDDIPAFCHTIEVLNLSNNALCGPPYWVWTENPINLRTLNLSHNINITSSFINGYFEELLQYRSNITTLKISNCKLRNHLKLLKTFPKLEVIELGSEKLSHISMNHVAELPCEGVQGHYLHSLNVTNTNLYNIRSNIDIFTNIVEINLSQNYISGLPSEFCNLKCLEICILSFNSILYLPDEIGNLKHLKILLIDNNELCSLPDSIQDLINLERFDVYNNCLYEVPKLSYVPEIDVAQNYLDEPDDLDYVEKKQKLRVYCSGRFNGRKLEVVRSNSEHSPDTCDDEEYLQFVTDNSCKGTKENQLPSSPEDWDSDDYWVPRFCGRSNTTPHSTWHFFVKRKMEEGSFCPIDAHPVSLAEKVKYEKLCYPKIEHESDGQFDDISDDSS